MKKEETKEKITVLLRERRKQTGNVQTPHIVGYAVKPIMSILMPSIRTTKKE